MGWIVLKKQSGIVLKNYAPQKCKLAVLDNALGKIMCVPNRQNICAGSLISYDITHQRTIYFARDIELLYMPLDLAKEDILFLHHVLEICYYFIPVGSMPVTRTTSEIFKFIQFLYSSEYLLKHLFFKKIFLFKLLVSLGVYLPGNKFKNVYFHRLASLSIDMIVNEDIDLEVERDLDVWLSNCVSMHPCVDYFKTVHFLKG